MRKRIGKRRPTGAFPERLHGGGKPGAIQQTQEGRAYARTGPQPEPVPEFDLDQTTGA
jgi:hypothetical protein